MIPWSIAILAIFYAILATSSAATIWQVGQRQLERSLAWPVTWCVLSSMLVVGLVLLKPWARKLAIYSSIIMMLGSLGAAWMAIVQAEPEPIRSLITTGLASVQLVVIRYLTRPRVKAWFADPTTTQDLRHKTQDLSLES